MIDGHKYDNYVVFMSSKGVIYEVSAGCVGIG